MATNNNLKDFLTDVANSIRIAEGSTELINPQDFSTRISALSSSGGSSKIKILNKLEGAMFGGPSFSTIKLQMLHKYEVEGNVSNVAIIRKDFYYDSISENFTYSYQYAGGTIQYIDESGYPTLGNFLSYYQPGSVSTKEGVFTLFMTTSLELYMQAVGRESSTEPAELYIIFFDDENNYDVDYIEVQSTNKCFTRDTKITLSDKSYKKVQDITYNDELLVWNFDKGQYDVSKPLWIKKTQTANYYYKVVLEDGKTLKLVGDDGKCHRLFCKEEGKFISATDMIGKTTYTEESSFCKVISCERVEEVVEYYNIITKTHINLFADGVLTSCRYNNMYPIVDMKFVKPEKEDIPIWKQYEKFRPHRILDRYINDLRLYEQNFSVEEMISYCESLEGLRKKINDFEENKNVINNIEDVEVCWVSPTGDVYGFKSYMPGQNNHIILSELITKDSNITVDNSCSYLEQMGWLKITTDFVTNLSGKLITDPQMSVLREFMKVPGKLKKEGNIRIGAYTSPYVSISEIENMDKYSFEYRKVRN